MPTPKSVELDRGIEARNSATKSCSRLGDFAINKRSTISELLSFKLNLMIKKINDKGVDSVGAVSTQLPVELGGCLAGAGEGRHRGVGGGGWAGHVGLSARERVWAERQQHTPLVPIRDLTTDRGIRVNSAVGRGAVKRAFGSGWLHEENLLLFNRVAFLIPSRFNASLSLLLLCCRPLASLIALAPAVASNTSFALGFVMTIVTVSDVTVACYLLLTINAFAIDKCSLVSDQCSPFVAKDPVPLLLDQRALYQNPLEHVTLSPSHLSLLRFLASLQ